MTRIKRITLFVALLVLTSAFLASAAGDLTPGEARKLIASVAGIQLPSDAVRVKSISSFGSSAVVVAQVETAFRFTKENEKWRATEIRTGDRKWEDIDLLIRAVNAEKSERARAELETIATALEAHRRERGFYVEAKTDAALMDHLNPRFLTRVIRVDPWHSPYFCETTRTTYRIWSAGPDGKSGTSDDVVRAGSED